MQFTNHYHSTKIDISKIYTLTLDKIVDIKIYAVDVKPKRLEHIIHTPILESDTVF